jgi:hypothetical protein
VVGTFAPQGADEALDERMLPGRPACRQHFLDPIAWAVRRRSDP